MFVALTAAIAAAALVFFAGLAIFVFGWRGRRIDDHPRCRACGFDVAGLSRQSGAICPECARPIDGRIRIGNRRRRWAWVAVGLVLLFPPIGGGGAIVWSGATGFDWNTAKPVWWLMADLRSADRRRASAAGDELADRGSSDELSEPQLAELLDETLVLQVDPTRGWSPALGDLVEQSYLKGHLGHSEYGRFLSQSLVVEVRLNERVPRDKPAGVSVRFSSGRTGTATRVSARFELTGTDDPYGGPAPELGLSIGGGFQVASGGSSTSSLEGKILDALDVGEHKLRFDVDLWLPQAGGGSGPPDEPAETRVITVPFEVLPIGTVVVDVIDDSSLGSDVRSWMTSVELAWSSGADGAPILQYSIDFAGERTVPLAFLLEAEIGGERFGGSTLAVSPGTRQSGFGGGLFGAAAQAERVTLILTSDEDAAIAAGFTEYWGGSLRFEGIPMEISDAALSDRAQIAPGDTGGAHPEPGEN